MTRGFQEELNSQLSTACQDAIAELPRQIRSESIYGIALYTNPAFSGFLLVVNTEESLARRTADQTGRDAKLLEMLQDHPDLLAKATAYKEPKDYLRVVADEWEYFDIVPEPFNEVNEWMSEVSGQDDYWLATSCSDACKDALRSVRESKLLEANCFSRDVLLCLQFPDLSNDEPALLSLAESLNSVDWNEKLRSVWGGQGVETD